VFLNRCGKDERVDQSAEEEAGRATRAAEWFVCVNFSVFVVKVV
jgi:hypothetical protein